MFSLISILAGKKSISTHFKLRLIFCSKNISFWNVSWFIIKRWHCFNQNKICKIIKIVPSCQCENNNLFQCLKTFCTWRFYSRLEWKHFSMPLKNLSVQEKCSLPVLILHVCSAPFFLRANSHHRIVALWVNHCTYIQNRKCPTVTYRLPEWTLQIM